MSLQDIALYAYNNGVVISFEGVMIADIFPAIQITARKGDLFRSVELSNLDDENRVKFLVEGLICDIKRAELEGRRSTMTEETKYIMTDDDIDAFNRLVDTINDGYIDINEVNDSDEFNLIVRALEEYRTNHMGGFAK